MSPTMEGETFSIFDQEDDGDEGVMILWDHDQTIGIHQSHEDSTWNLALCITLD